MSDRALRVSIIVAAVILTAVQALAAPPMVFTERNRVHACLPLSGGRVLAGSRGGLTLLDGKGTARRAWTRANGLLGTAVFTLHARGDRVWVGTERGLARLSRANGKLQIDLTAASPAVRDIISFDGRLYVATWKGAFSLESGATRLQAVPLARNRANRPRLTSASVFDGALYFGSAGQGIWRLERGALAPSTFGRGLPSKHVWSLAAGRGGRLYAGTLGGVVAVDSQGRTTPLSTMDARALLPLSGSSLLVGGYGQGLKRRAAGRIFTEPGQPDARAFVNTISRDHGTTCVGTRRGLWIRGRAQKAYRRLLLPGPPSNDISALAADGVRLWVGTFDKGLASITRGRWQRFRGTGDRLDGRVNGLAVERGARGSTLWVATSRGVFRVRANRVQRFGRQHGLRHEEVHSVIALRRGGALAGTARGAVIIRGEKVTPLDVKQGLPVASIWAAAEDDKGVLWLGTSKGLYRWFPKQRRYDRYSVSSGHLKEDYITALALFGGAVYAGTYNSGVTRLVKKGDSLEATHLGGGWVNFGGLRVHAGKLYACTMTGLRTLPLGQACGGGGKPCAWRHHRGAAPGRDVTAVVPAAGGLWVASRRGLAKHVNWLGKLKPSP